MKAMKAMKAGDGRDCWLPHASSNKPHNSVQKFGPASLLRDLAISICYNALRMLSEFGAALQKLSLIQHVLRRQ